MTLFYFISWPTAIWQEYSLQFPKKSSAGNAFGAPFKVAKAAPNSSITQIPVIRLRKTRPTQQIQTMHMSRLRIEGR